MRALVTGACGREDRAVRVRFLVPLIVLAASCRDPAADLPAAPAPRSGLVRPAETVRAAAVTVRFSSGRLDGAGEAVQADRLEVSAVFADADPRDLPLLADLGGQTPPGPLSVLDTCVAEAGHDRQAPIPAPHAWLQLLDVGNVALQTAQEALPLRVQMVPSLHEAARGVRYDGERANSRHWLAAGMLRLTGTGGDGVDAFAAEIAAPRPVRLTHVGAQPVRAGKVQGPTPDTDLTLRWGSVDATADLELQLGAVIDPSGAARQGRLRCRLRDDGEFTVPQALRQTLPPRSPERPWLALLVRSRDADVPGFVGRPMRLELTDAAHVY